LSSAGSRSHEIMIVCISRSTGTRLSSTISRRGASGFKLVFEDREFGCH
jgi:hypothetical protein